MEADASTTLLQCTFTSNEVSNQNNGTGGAIAILDMEAPGFIEDCVFNSNNATEGTFIFIEEPTSPRLIFFLDFLSLNLIFWDLLNVSP